jgi:hypothetical protein
LGAGKIGVSPAAELIERTVRIATARMRAESGSGLKVDDAQVVPAVLPGDGVDPVRVIGAVRLRNEGISAAPLVSRPVGIAVLWRKAAESRGERSDREEKATVAREHRRRSAKHDPYRA